LGMSFSLVEVILWENRDFFYSNIKIALSRVSRIGR
jgi:hypothetical protein